MKVLNALLIIIFVITNVNSNFAEDNNKTDEAILFQAQKFTSILKTLYENHVDSIDVEKVSEAAFQAMLQEIDNYGKYLSADERKKVKNRDEGKSVGIGLKLLPVRDTLTAYYVYPESPSDSAGLEAGDKILFIDGENAVSTDAGKAQDLIEGEEGSEVTIIAKRGNSSNLKEYKIGRNKFSVSSVSASFIISGTDIGYISYGRFTKVSDEEFIEEAKILKDKGMKKMILDLRSNPGGYLRQITNIADQFLYDGDTVTYTQARNENFKFEYETTEEGFLKDMPLIIMIDDKSASAAEAVAGCIQDLDRGLILGQPSYGKGSAQKVWELKDGSAFQFTIARYHTPSGRCIQKIRVDEENTPELDPRASLSMDEESLQDMKEIIRKTGGNKRLPVYYTEKGRPVVGGGGIIPDHNVKQDTTTLLTKVYARKHMFSEFAFIYLENERLEIVENYGDDFTSFVRKFSINDSILTDFKKYSVGNKIWNEQMFQTDLETIKTRIKAEIANAVWGKDAARAVLLTTDKPTLKAIELIPEAVEMASEYEN